MHETIKPVEKVKMLTLISLLSKYDLFHISVSDGQEFNATEIVNTEFGCLEFRRCLATSVYSNDIIIDIVAESDKTFICKTKDKKYIITALHIKKNRVFYGDRYNDIFDLIKCEYFDQENIIVEKGKKEVIVIVDPNFIEGLTRKEYNRLKGHVNTYLHGFQKSVQTSRTIYFMYSFCDCQYKIFCGLFDIENKIVLNCRLLYSENSSIESSVKENSEITNTLNYVTKLLE